MGANSVTGTGPGQSYGRFKPEHNKGCGCRPTTTPAEPPARTPVGCVVRTWSGSGVVKYRSGRSISIKIC